MKNLILPLLVFGIALSWSGQSMAQELPQKEGSQKEKKTEIPPALEVIPADPNCHQPCTVPNILTVEKLLPFQVIVPREVVTTIKRKTLAIDYKEEKRIVTDYVMKPKEVLREVPCTTMQPCTVTDPCTGVCKTILKPVTEMKLEKDTVFCAQPETHEVTIKIPYLKEVEEVVPQTTVLFEYRTHLEPRYFVTAFPGQPEPQTRYLVTPRPCPPSACEHP